MADLCTRGPANVRRWCEYTHICRKGCKTQGISSYITIAPVCTLLDIAITDVTTVDDSMSARIIGRGAHSSFEQPKVFMQECLAS